MEEKQIANVRTITGELIGGFILYGIVLGTIYSVLYAAISDMFSSEELIFKAVIAIILQGITVFCIWRCSIATTFRKRLIAKEDIQRVIRNLIIFTIVLCLISAVMNYIEVSVKLEQSINLNASIMLSEKYMQYIYDTEEIAKYQEEKEKVIKEAKTELYTYLVVLEMGLLAVYVGVVPLQKKAILKYAV